MNHQEIIVVISMVAFGFVLKQLLDVRDILGSMGRTTNSMINRCDRMIRTIGSIKLKSVQGNRKAAIRQLKKKANKA